LLREPDSSSEQRPGALMQRHDLVQEPAGRRLRMGFSQVDGGLLDLLNRILTGN
jgi:hypothetical protein